MRAIDCTFVAKRETHMSGTKPDVYAKSTAVSVNDFTDITAPNVVGSSPPPMAASATSSAVEEDENLMAEYVLSKLSQDGKVTVMNIQGSLEFVAHTTMAFKRGMKLSIVFDQTLHVVRGDTVRIHIRDVVLEE